MNEQEVFTEALERDAAERKGYLDGACRDNPVLRKRVEELLAAHKSSADFMQSRDDLVPPTLATPPREKPGTEIGSYTIREQIGEGGFGLVYVAEQTDPVRRRVALKIIKPGMDSKEVIARFEAERQALALMNHPNVARVLDAGATDNGRPFFVMELVHGLPITEFCDKNKLPTRSRLELFLDVCRAVHHAHQKGIIHRDLKPSNIMVTLHDGKPVPKVIDFGVAKALSQQLTEKTIYTSYGQVVGTPQYMSPEQAEMSGLGIDIRSDIYSLGVLLYELLTGTSPVDKKRLLASGYAEMMRIIREEEPPRPSKRISTLGQEATAIAQQRRTDGKRLSRSLQGELDWIVMKSLDKDRERRYDTAANLAEDIARFLGNEPVQACPPSTIYRLRKFALRHRAATATTAAVVATMLLGLVGTTWQMARATRAEAIAETRRRDAEDEGAKALAAEERATQQRDRALAAEDAATERQQEAEQQRRRAREHLYAGQIRLAQLAVQSEDFGEATKILENWVPTPKDEVFRGWEWYFVLQQARRDELATLYGDFMGVVWARDNERFATWALDGVRIWSAADHSEIRLLNDFPSRPDRIAWSSETSALAVGLRNGEVHIFHGDSFRRQQVIEGAYGYRGALAFSRQGNLLASSAGRRVSIHDWSKKRQISSITVERSEVPAISWSPTVDHLAVFTFETCEIWSTQPSELLLQIENARRLGSWSPDGMTIAAKVGQGGLESTDGHIGLFDASTGKLLGQLPAGNLDRQSVEWSPDGSQVVTGGSRNTVRIWDVESQSLSRTLHGHTDYVRDAGWSADGKRLLSVGADRTVRIWKTEPEEADLALYGHRGRVSTVVPSPDGSLVASGGEDATVRIWDVQARECVHLLAGHSSAISQVTWARDGRHVASASQDGTVKLWDVVSGKQKASLGHDEGVSGVAWSPDGRQLVSSTRPNGRCLVWDVASGTLARSLFGHLEWSRAIDWSPDGRLVASLGTRDLWVWEVQRGKALWHHFIGGGPGFFEDGFVRHSPDSKQLAWPAKNDVQIVDIATRKVLQVLKGHLAPVGGATWMSGGQRLATCSDDGTSRVWDVRQGAELLRLSGHHGPVKAIAWNPSAQSLMTGGLDGVIRVWSAAEGYRLTKDKASFSGHATARWQEAKQMVKAGNLSGAEAVFTKLLESVSDDWRLWWDRGTLFVKSNIWENASTDLQRALALAPDAEKFDILVTDAMVCLQLGDHNRFLKDCRELVSAAIESGNDGVKLDAAWICSLHPQTDLEIPEARILYDHVSALAPQAIPITGLSPVACKGQVKRLWIQLRQGKFDEALNSQLDYTFLPLNERQVEGLVAVVRTFARLQSGDITGAKDAFTRATEIRSLGNRQAAYWMYDVTFDILYREIQGLIQQE